MEGISASDHMKPVRRCSSGDKPLRTKINFPWWRSFNGIVGGLKANLEEVELLIQQYSPSVLCLQETLVKGQDINLRQFSCLYSTPVVRDGRAHGGSAVFVQKNVPHSPVTITSPLHAVAARVSLFKPVTICFIYLPPSSLINLNGLDALLTQLPSPIILLGDFKAHSTIWGSPSSDTKGKLIEDFINNNNLCFLNSKTITYIHPATGSKTAIDLSICDPSLMMDFSVHDDLCGSDHFPIVLKTNKPTPNSTARRWKLNKADWSTFGELCERGMSMDEFEHAIDPAEAFTAKLLDIAAQTIPTSSINPKHLSKPWFTDACKEAIKNRKAALKAFNSQPSPHNLDLFRMSRAKARRSIREKKRASWQTYVSKLNTRTSVKKAWDMVGKISGKTSITTISHLKHANKLIYRHQRHFKHLSLNLRVQLLLQNYTPKFQQYKQQKKSKH